MESFFSSTINRDDIGGGEVRSQLQTLKKLYGLLDPTTDLNTAGTSDQILDDKCRLFLMKILDEATQQTLKRQAKILPLENRASMKISDQKEEYQHGLKPKINYSPLPSFQRRNSNHFKSQPSMKSRHNQPKTVSNYNRDQSCIANRAPSGSTITPNRIAKTNPANQQHKEKFSSGYNTAEPAHKRTQTDRTKKTSSSESSESNRKSFVQKRRNYNKEILPPTGKIKGNKIRPFNKFEEKALCLKEDTGKRVPHVRRLISDKEKSAEVLSDSKTSSGSDSCSNTSCDSVPSRNVGSLPIVTFRKPEPFAKRPEHYKKCAESPSPSRHSKSPMNHPNKVPSHHNNKPLNKMPSHHNNKILTKMPSHNNKALTKLPSHHNNNKAMIKMASHHNNNKALTKMPSHHNNNKALTKMASHHNNNKALTKMASHYNNNKALTKMPSHHKEVGQPKKPKVTTKKKLNKTPDEKNKKKESRFKRIKNKLAVVFHHHHHHHHHHHSSSEEGGDINKKRHHRSPWKFLKGMIHRSSERAVEIVPAQHHHQHRYMRDLFHMMISHLWGKNRRKKKAQLGRGNKRKKLHWWQKFRKRGA